MIEKSNYSAPGRQDDLFRRSRFGVGFRRAGGSVDSVSAPVMEPVNTVEKAPGNGEETVSKRLAMAYIPNQAWQNLLSPESALMNGTVFRELVFPFEGRTVRRR